MSANVNSARQCSRLTQLLRAHLPQARAEATGLADWPELQLYLLNSDFAQQQLTSEQMQAVLKYPAYWAFCWASGQVLAGFLRRNPQWVQGKRVLDFGSGSGVAGIAAALLGADKVLACDLDPDALRATAINARLNAVKLELYPDFADCSGDIDVILVADVLYDRENLPWLDQLRERAPLVLVADSRVRDFSHPAYRRLGQWRSTTLPDLDEFDEFGRVSVYAAGDLDA